MAADYGLLTENLRLFYDFTDKVVLYVGAGGRQLLDPSFRTRRLIAIDQNAESLRELETNVAAKGMSNVEVLAARFEDITLRGDVVYFEFCLHGMANAEETLRHARTLAPDTVVYDHLPDSEWIFYGAEEDNVRLSTAAMERFGIRRRQQFCTDQRFRDHAELLAKLSTQGPLAIERAQRFADTMNIVIPMRYGLALL